MNDIRNRASSSVRSDEKGNKLSYQYGGVHQSLWVDRLPRSWVPYVQLARLSPPAGLVLIYFPHLFGILHAAITYQSPVTQVLPICVLLLGGSLFFSNAAHAWNDLIDRPIDACVARTKNRPIARGTISPKAAFIFIITQALIAASFLLFLTPSAAIATTPTIIFTIYYPWSKRHTYFSQFVLGFCLAWGIIVGCAAVGAEQPWKDRSALCLVLVSIFWTVIYDTIYSYQDIEDDIKIGLKSTAVLFGNYTKLFLWVCYGFMCTFIVLYGQLSALGIGYYIITLGGSLLSLGTMIASVDLKDEADCWWWFVSDFWSTGVSIAGGLVFEYVSCAHFIK
ncbi:UbiA prenyltransferase [Daldinia loculata]|uniref:UbiA prenyltransferase n=1 Tax=Daldinia loculata TaxID=103429 RepID=UPI0020C3A794|nr:UbiA prenyltransferase [Daldinia loculata]KAI1645177.1 UbiA prenyltransferase [Daldinia loculata]